MSHHPRVLGLNKYLVIAVGLTISLALLWRIYLPSESMTNPLTWQDQLPDSYMTGVTLTQYGQDGHLAQKMTATKITHIPQDNHYHYQSPRMTLFANQQQWVLQANHGDSKDGLDIIKLAQNVTIDHKTDEHQATTHASTNTLTVHSKTQSIDTDQPVRIEHPGILITGVGLHGDLAHDEIKTLSKTNTTIR